MMQFYHVCRLNILNIFPQDSFLLNVQVFLESLVAAHILAIGIFIKGGIGNVIDNCFEKIHLLLQFLLMQLEFMDEPLQFPFVQGDSYAVLLSIRHGLSFPIYVLVSWMSRC
jgi:lipoprotein signal peptidase